MYGQLLRSVKNAKLFTAILSPSRPAIYLLICIRNNKHAACQNAKIIYPALEILDYLFVRQMSEIRHEGKGDCCTLRLLTNLFTGLTVYAGFPLQVNAFYYKENHGMCECDVTICNFNKQYFILGNSHGISIDSHRCTPLHLLVLQ